MQAAEFFQRLTRKLELRLPLASLLRRVVWTLRGAKLGKGTNLPRCRAPWPHQVSIGQDCILQQDIFFNYDNFWTPGPSIIIGDRSFIGRGVEFNIQGRIEVGEDCLIASHCSFIDHDHGMASGAMVNTQPNEIAPIILERNVWLGAGCIVLKGVTIGAGSIIGAGSVVTKSIPANEIWVGNPAHCLRAR